MLVLVRLCLFIIVRNTDDGKNIHGYCVINNFVCLYLTLIDGRFDVGSRQNQKRVGCHKAAVVVDAEYSD